MNELTEQDRGVFLVTTQGSTHVWTITDDYITVQRNSNKHNRYGLDAINGRDMMVTHVSYWPMVGECFHYHMDGAIPWTRSSTIRSIERLK